MTRAIAILAALTALTPLAARAEDVLTTVSAVHAACESARERELSPLYVLDVAYRMERYDADEGRVVVDTRRNLSALDGHISLLLSGLEPIAFEASEERAASLEQAASAGVRLRLGFFIGFDEPSRQPCVVRSEHAVTIVRADLAFAELVEGEAAVARMETDRLQAWADDQRALAVPGEGPRGAVGEASFDDAQLPPEAWQRALEVAAVRARIGQCHAEGIGRGASRHAQVVLRLNVETRTGRVRRADVVLSSLADEAEGQCIARAVGAGAQLPAAPTSWQADAVDLTVPVRLAAD
jgi:hypothetical protein